MTASIVTRLDNACIITYLSSKLSYERYYTPSHPFRQTDSTKKAYQINGKLSDYAFLRKALKINEINKITRNTQVIAAPGGAS